MFHAEMDPLPETPQEERIPSPIRDSELHHPFSAGLRKGSSVNLPEKLRPPPLRADHYSTFLHSRPQSLETFAIENILRLAHLAPHLNLHIVHLSASTAVPIIRQAQKAGVNITAETCFHYLSLQAEKVQDGATQFKCCPPIREEYNQNLLWDALFKNDISTVVSDHSPCTPDLKKLAHGDFIGAWGGIATIGLGLSVLWTEGKARGVRFQDLVRWMAVGTSKQVGLYGQKGVIQVGADADLCIWSPEESFTVWPLVSLVDIRLRMIICISKIR
jgi:allantoinase